MNPNYSLFSTRSSESGYRLHTVEVLNWGVFDGKIFSISPKGNTSLLTGANGAGKTTYMEAILTLMVPERRMRRYNQASGASTKDERSEESYVLGEIGEIESDQSREIQRLRPDKSKTYSVILAKFQNEDHFITLAQVRWFAGSEMKRSFIVSHCELSIERDFTPFDANGQWKRRLRNNYSKTGSKDVVEFFDSPGKYAESMRRHLGMRSEKATTLFSQTVGLKVLGNLDEFIRRNMLEATNIEDEFSSLKEGFQSLLGAHNQILKAEAQLKLLTPISEKVEELDQLKERAKELDELKETAPLYFTTLRKDLLSNEIEKQKVELERYNSQIDSIESDIEQKHSAKTDLIVAIKQDEVGNKIANLDKQIKDQNREKESREKKLKKYNSLISKVNLQENPSVECFEVQLEKVRELKVSSEEEVQSIQRKQFGEEQNIEQLKTAYDDKCAELETLNNQKNNITGRVADIRQEILLATGASEAEIPFVGELIQVKSESKQKWEFAIEKLLHNFALQLLVPEQYYSAVNEYVNNNNLRGRVIYQQIKKESHLNAFIADVPDSLRSKIDINTQSDYSEWVENHILKNFDYVCCDDLDSFKSYKRALTSSGLIKNDRRHEKDDRSNNIDKSRFVLGWDNKDKIKITKLSLRSIDNEIKEAEKRIKTYERQYNRLNSEKETAIKLSEYTNYQELDWQSMAVDIQKITEERDALVKTNDRVETLKRQLEGLEAELKKLNESRDALKDKKISTNNSLENNHRELVECNAFLSNFSDIDWADKFATFKSTLDVAADLTLRNIKTEQERISNKFQKDIERNNSAKNKSESRLQEYMTEFKRPKQELRDRFIDWESDTDRLSLNLEFVEDYIKIYNRLKNEELYAYKERFKKYLNGDMIDRMTKFQAQLEIQEESIRENIEALNSSLEKINFRPNPETYIYLDIKRDNSYKIRKFRTDLKEWKPNIREYQTSKDDKILEDSFLKIKSLIEYLSENEQERRYVTDVRNWLNFSAKELYREDKRIFRTYDNTGKLSGGEKAQLTYTILGSAIAYQFGISQSGRNTNSFRFICIDESFSNQDAEKANYLMQLCQQLHLQLLCVTPEDKTGIIEPYISAVHFVKRQDNRDAVIYDLPILQFQAERETYIANKL